MENVSIILFLFIKVSLHGLQAQNSTRPLGARALRHSQWEPAPLAHSQWEPSSPRQRPIGALSPSHTANGSPQPLAHSQWEPSSPRQQPIRALSPSHTANGSPQPLAHSQWEPSSPRQQPIRALIPSSTANGSPQPLVNGQWGPCILSISFSHIGWRYWLAQTDDIFFALDLLLSFNYRWKSWTV